RDVVTDDALGLTGFDVLDAEGEDLREVRLVLGEVVGVDLRGRFLEHPRERVAKDLRASEEELHVCHDSLADALEGIRCLVEAPLHVRQEDVSDVPRADRRAQSVLVLEVEVDRPLAHSSTGGDLVHDETLVAPLEEHRLCGGEDRLSSSLTITGALIVFRHLPSNSTHLECVALSSISHGVTRRSSYFW